MIGVREFGEAMDANVSALGGAPGSKEVLSEAGIDPDAAYGLAGKYADTLWQFAAPSREAFAAAFLCGLELGVLTMRRELDPEGGLS